MMIDCLLIGGLCHGLRGRFRSGPGNYKVKVIDHVDAYVPENYLMEGRLYRIARVDPTAEQVAEISNLIKATRLPSIAGG